MKKHLVFVAVSMAVIFFLTGFSQVITVSSTTVTGAWHLQKGSVEQVLVFQDGYFSHTVFDKTNKKFVSTYGGIYKTDGNGLKLLLEFDTRSTEGIGKEKSFTHIN